MPAGDWRRLGDYVRRERLRNGRTQAQFAASVGISVRTLGSIEQAHATSYDENTKAAIEDALAWEPGSLDDFVSGGRPRTADRDLAAIQQAWPHLTPTVRRALAAAARDAAWR